MAWDDDKSTAQDPDNPTADEQVTADEWDNHVADQKNHSTRHESGGTDEISLGALAGQIATGQLSDAAVTAAKIADNAVGVSELMDALGTSASNKIPGTTYFTNANVEALEAGSADIATAIAGIGSAGSIGADGEMITSDNVEIADDGSVVLVADHGPGNHSTFGLVGDDGGNGYGAMFAATGASVTLLQSSGNWATSDTDDNICIYRDGSGELVLKNRLGGTRQYSVLLFHLNSS